MALTLLQARQVVEACIEKAKSLGVFQGIAVVDEAGNLITIDRMDGTGLLRDQFAQAKAFTAVFFRQSTRQSAKFLEINPQLFHGAQSVFPGRLFLVPGGFPIVMGGKVVGGLGVSGATGEQDEEVAQAGLRVLGE